MEKLQFVRNMLLRGRTWRYLRYLHARSAILEVPGIRSVLVIGAGHGLAELALAVEFPHINFMLSDWSGATHNTQLAHKWSKEWALNNVQFCQMNILDTVETGGLYDLVYSVEVLEHIENAALAAENMWKLSSGYVFCLVPFSEESRNRNPLVRQRLLESHGHHVCGYDAKGLIALFPNPVCLKGAYWVDQGVVFRKKLHELTDAQIDQEADNLAMEAKKDLINRIPVTLKDALGIWVLSKKEESQA